MKRAISLILSVMMLVGMFSMIPFASAENKYYVVNDGTTIDNVAVRGECEAWTTLEQHDGYFTLKSGENHQIYAGVFNRGVFFTLGEEVDMTSMPIFEVVYRVDPVEADKQYHFQVNFCNGTNGDGYNCNNLGFTASSEWQRWPLKYSDVGNAGLADVDMTKIKKISLSQMNYNKGVSLGTSFDFKGVAIMDEATKNARTAEETRIQGLIDALDVTEENIASTAASVKEVKDALKAANESYPNFMVNTAKYDAALPIFTAYYESMNKEFDAQFSAAEDKNCVPANAGGSSNDNSTYTEGTQSVAISGTKGDFRFWIFQNGQAALDITDAINADGEFYVTYDLWCGEGNTNWNRLVTCVGTTESINGWKEKAAVDDRTTKLNVGWNHYAVKFNVKDFTKNPQIEWDPAKFGLVYIWGDGASRDLKLKIDDVRVMSVRSYEEKFAAKNAAKDVISAIAELGEVTEENLDAVKALKAKYDALNDEQKALVTNSAKLDEAYAKYLDLVMVEFNASFNAAEDKNIIPASPSSESETTTYTEGTQSVASKGGPKGDFRFWIFRNGSDPMLDITNAIDKNGDFYVTYDLWCGEGNTNWNRIVTQLGVKDGMTGWKQNASFVDKTTKLKVGWNHYAIKMNISMFTENPGITWDPAKFAFIVVWGDGASRNISLKIDDVRIMGTKTYANDFADICAAKDVFTAIVEAGTDPDKVLAAAEAYNALTEKQKGLVANAGDIDAKVEAANAAKAAAVDALIDAIGTVTKNSDDAIAAARAAYDALNETQKALVTKYDVLTAAEEAYKNLSDYFSENASIVNWRAGFIGTAQFKDGVAATYGRGASNDYGDKIGMIAAGMGDGAASEFNVKRNLTDDDTVIGWAVANVTGNVMLHSAMLDWSVVAPNVGDKFTLVVKGEARTRTENDILSNTDNVGGDVNPHDAYTFDIDETKAVKSYSAAEYDALPVYTDAERGYTYRRMVLETARTEDMNGQVRVQVNSNGYTTWMVVYAVEAYNAAGEKVWERTAQDIYDGNNVGVLGANWGSHWITDAGVRFNKTGDGTSTDMWGLYAAKQETAGVYALECSMKMTDVAEGNVISIGRNSSATGVQTWTTITDKQVKGDYAIYTHMFKYDPDEGDGRIEPIIRLYGNADINLTNIRLVKISDVKAVEFLIDSIGEVTIDSKAAIDEARAAYDALSEEDKNLVTNYETLVSAETAYARLQPIFNYAHTADEINEYDTVDNEGNPAKAKDWRQHVPGWTTPEIDEEDYVQGTGSIVLEGDDVGNIATTFRMMNRITNFQADLNDTPYFEMFWKTDVDLTSQIQINFGYNREDGRNWAPGKDFAANRWQRIQVKVTDVAPAVEMGENGMIINSLRICYLKPEGFPETITVHMDGLMFFNEAFLTARTAEETRIEALIDALSNDSTDEELLAVKAALDESTANYANFYPNNMVKWNRLYNAYLAKQAVADAIAKIDAIGEVALTDDCKALIDAADAAFNALTDAQKEDVTNKQTLEDAKAKYADLAAVKAVEDAIDAIGEVTKDSGQAITDAENAYNALTEGQKAMVNADKVAALAKAREDYDKLAVKYGHLAGNDEITAADALIALQIAVGKFQPTEEQAKAANVDGEGEVTATDALLILQYAVGKIDKFPVEDMA